jgi:CrcB protein
MIQTLLTVAAGGAIGSSLRYLVNVSAMRLFGPAFPWATLTVNVIGSFLMGALVVWFANRDLMRLAPFLMTGVLGGFTTFSAFSLDTVTLWQRGEATTAMIYVAASIILSLAALLAGMATVRGLA